MNRVAAIAFVIVFTWVCIVECNHLRDAMATPQPHTPVSCPSDQFLWQDTPGTIATCHTQQAVP
jgi:hypothetical protein